MDGWMDGWQLWFRGTLEGCIWDVLGQFHGTTPDVVKPLADATRSRLPNLEFFPSLRSILEFSQTRDAHARGRSIRSLVWHYGSSIIKRPGLHVLPR
jgi:hypothetical protein